MSSSVYVPIRGALNSFGGKKGKDQLSSNLCSKFLAKHGLDY